MSSAAKAAHIPEVSVAMAGVPVAGHTWLKLLVITQMYNVNLTQ